MTCNVWLYYNTGFNAVNLPDSPALLNTMEYLRFPSLEVLDHTGLTSIRIKVSGLSDVYNADYCRVIALSETVADFDEFYYVITGYQMLTSDVAELYLVPDFITSAGGVKTLKFLDGITERHTVSDDTLFAYTQDDELMAPQKPLQFKSNGMLWGKKPEDTEQDYIIAESTVDLLAIDDSLQTGITYRSSGPVDKDTGKQNEPDTSETETAKYVFQVYPFTKGVVGRTVYNYTDGTDTIKAYAPHTRLYDTSQANIAQSMGVLRALAAEGAILSQVAYPYQFFSRDSYKPGYIEEGSDGQILSITSKPTFKDSGLKLDAPYATSADGTYNIQNNRLLYGEYNKYGLMTASGEQGEYKPEQILKVQRPDVSPIVTLWVDPRPSGKPYFRFKNYLNITKTGQENEQLIDKMNGCVSGLQWANAPLVYTDARGSYMTTRRFENKAAVQASAYNFAQEKNRQAYLSTVGSTADFLIPHIKAAAGRASDEMATGGYMNGLINQMNEYENAKNSISYTKAQYENARAMEEAEYNYSMNVVVPDVLFPFNADFIRDFCGNGVYVYRYYYSVEDVARIDKLLTMYGYKDTKRLESKDFNARQYFDYVRAKGVSVEGTSKKLPIRIKNAIGAQLSVGARFWHVKPDSKHYMSNPIKK